MGDFYARMTMEKIKAPFKFANKYVHNMDNDHRKKLSQVDQSKTHLNRVLIDVDESHFLNKDGSRISEDKKCYYNACKKRMEEEGLRLRKTKSANQQYVLGMEVVMSLNKDDHETDMEAWIEANLKYLRETFGEKNIVNAVLHLDESHPHIHAVVLPMEDGKFIAGRFMGNNKVMSESQDIYYEYVKHLGLKRGVKNTAKAADYNTVQKWYKKVQEIADKKLPEKEKGESDKDYYEKINDIYTDLQLALAKSQDELKKEKNRNTNIEFSKRQAYEEDLSALKLLKGSYDTLINTMAKLKEKYNIKPNEMEKVLFTMANLEEYLKDNPEKKDDVLVSLKEIKDMSLWAENKLKGSEEITIEEELENIKEQERQDKKTKEK